jgi:oligopeptide transport system substrate-binding protein
MKHWEHGQGVFVRNPRYYLADRIYAGMVTYHEPYDMDMAGLLEMFANGALSNVSFDKWRLGDVPAELVQNVYQTAPHGRANFLLFNYASPDGNVAAAVENVNFRKAVFSAIDRKALLGTTIPENQGDYLIDTLNRPRTIFTEFNRDYFSFGTISELSLGYDPAAALRYLEEAIDELGGAVEWPVTLIWPMHTSELGIAQSRLFRHTVEEALGGNVLVDFRSYNDEWEYYLFLERGEFDVGVAYAYITAADPSYKLSALLPDTDWDYFYWLTELAAAAGFADMLTMAGGIADHGRRLAAFANTEAFLINNAIILPYHAEGGEYALSRERRPFDGPNAEFGLSKYMFHDRTFGEPLTKFERELLYAEFLVDMGYSVR